MSPMLLHLLAVLQLATATKQSPAAPLAFNGRESQIEVQAPRLEVQVQIDGALDEPVWGQAALLTGFSQYTPVDGRPAEDSTHVLVWYAPDAIYVGVRAFEAHGLVNSTLANRDRIASDDHIQLILDTFNDRRRALVFGVNPLGVQSDGVLNEGTQTRSGGGFGSAPSVRDTADLSVDFVYQSKGRVTTDGYEIELRIPFKSIRYQSVDKQSWGFNVIRKVQHSNAEDTWTPARRGGASFLAQSGTLVGLTGLSRGLVLDLNPVTTARITGARPAAVGSSYAYDRENPEIGGNVRWGITSNLTMNGTVNPDFAEVEADVQQVVIDPRRAISFPEKRPFFLEGNEQFEVPNDLIYTRRLVQPVGAVKLNGKAAGMSIGLLSGIDDKGQSLNAGDPGNPLYNIVRLKRDIGPQSTVGLLYTDKADGDYYNRVAGVDGRVVFKKLYTLGFQGAHSFTGGDGDKREGSLWDTYLDRNGRRFGLRYSFKGIQPDFITATGFIRRGSIAQINLNHRFTYFGKPGGLIESVSPSFSSDWMYHYDDFRDFPSSEATEIKLHYNASILFRGGWRIGLGFFHEWFRYDPLLFPNYAFGQRQPDGTYIKVADFTGRHSITNFDYIFALTTPQWNTFSANGNVAFGADENFFEWSQSFVWLPTVNLDWRPSQKIRLNGQFRYQLVQRWDDRSTVFRRTLPRLKAEYQLTRAIFFRVVGQYDSRYQDDLRDDDDTNLPLVVPNGNGGYRPLLGSAANDFRMDYLFSFQPNPGTVIFAGYGSTLAEEESFRFQSLRRVNDGFFVKLSYLFRM
jgi:hypothetical protein